MGADDGRCGHNQRLRWAGHRLTQVSEKLLRTVRVIRVHHRKALQWCELMRARLQFGYCARPGADAGARRDDTITDFEQRLLVKKRTEPCLDHVDTPAAREIVQRMQQSEQSHSAQGI